MFSVSELIQTAIFVIALHVFYAASSLPLAVPEKEEKEWRCAAVPS